MHTAAEYQVATCSNSASSLLGRGFNDDNHSIRATTSRRHRFTTFNTSSQSQPPQYLLESCATLLNPDDSLTSKGDTGIGCIRNGFAAAILGTKLGLSFDAIKSALDFVRTPTQNNYPESYSEILT
jgi:hypothetical protein